MFYLTDDPVSDARRHYQYLLEERFKNKDPEDFTEEDEALWEEWELIRDNCYGR